MSDLIQLYATANIRVAELERENAELQATFDLMYSANQRGIKAWRESHPESAMVWPDQSKLVEWLLTENAALRRDVYQCPPTSENDYEGFKWRDACEELECEVAELRKALADAEELERYSGSNGERQWGRCSAWLHPDDAVIIISAKALDAARKETRT